MRFCLVISEHILVDMKFTFSIHIYYHLATVLCAIFDWFNHTHFLQSAKMFNYGTGWRKTCDILFVVFAAMFLVTRLVIFPSK